MPKSTSVLNECISLCLLSGFVQETSHKNQGLFKDFPAPNKNFPGPFVQSIAKLGMPQIRYTVEFDRIPPMKS